MLNSGEIVSSDKLILINNKIDNAQSRSYVVLFSLDFGKGNKVFACPLTKQTKTFNKHPENYFLIPNTLCDYFKLDFAKLDNIVIFNEEDLHNTGIKLDEEIVNRILNKINTYEPKETQKEQYEYIKEIIKYIELFAKLDKKANRSLKKQKQLVK
jgi:hypothetical protein